MSYFILVAALCLSFIIDHDHLSVVAGFSAYSVQD